MAQNNIKEVLTVSRKEYISPHLIRVYLTGENIEVFANTRVGINNKIAIPPKGVQKIYFPEKDPKTNTWKEMDPNMQAKIRTFTHRGIDLEKREIWIDFVAHGEEGPASSWAINCKKGDVLGVMMKNKKLELYKPAQNYILVGDATAIPVLSCILEDLPKDVRGHCFIEVHGKEDELDLQSKANIQIHWLHNPNPGKGSQLAEKVKSLPLPYSDRFAYIACEFNTVKELRNYFRKEKNWTNQELYAYSYWKAGLPEDRSVTDRRKEKDAIS